MAVAKTDTDTLNLSLTEKQDRFFRDLNSSRFMRILPDSVTLEIEKDTTTMKVLHDGEPEV